MSVWLAVSVFLCGCLIGCLCGWLVVPHAGGHANVCVAAGSYTHLTLPTILRVWMRYVYVYLRRLYVMH